MKSKKKWIVFIICLLASFVIGFSSELVHFLIKSNTTYVDDTQFSSDTAIYNQTEGTFITQSDNGHITYTLGGQHIDNVRLNVYELTKDEKDSKPTLSVCSDSSEVYNSKNVGENTHSIYQFKVPRTININDDVETMTFEYENLPGAKIEISYNVKPHYNYLIALLVTLLTFIVTCAIIGIADYKQLFIEASAAAIIIIMGIIFSFYIPQTSTFDEESHYIRSYNLASNNLLYDLDEYIDYPVDMETILNENNWIPHNYEDYSNYVDYAGSFKINDVTNTIFNTPQVVYTPLPYVSSGLFVKIAKILDLSVLRSLQLAKLGNVILYTLIVILSIAIAPRKKLFFLFYFALPMNVFFAASLGTDYFINGLLGLAVAMIYRFKLQERRMKIWEYILLIAVLCMIPCAKSTYAPALLLIAILSKKELPEKVPRALNYILAFALMFATFFITYWYGSRFGIAMWGRPNVDSAQQIDYFIHNPFSALYALLYTSVVDLKVNILVKYEHFAYIGHATGLGILEIPGLLSLSVLDTKEEKFEYELKAQDIIFTVLSILACFGLSMLALYVTFTPVGAGYVEGFQGRYCIPMALMIYMLIILSKKCKIKLKNNIIETVICFACTFASYIWVINVLTTHNV